MAVILNKSGNLEYLIAEDLTVPHCFTTRLGGVSQDHLSSMNIAHHRGDAPENVVRNFTILGNAIGFDPEKAVLSHQIHTDVIRVVTEKDCLGLDHHAYPVCDGLITATPGLALVIFTADCTPILYHDPVTGTVGAAHAGWRGTAADIAGKTVRAMVENFGCKPEDIRCAIGPNIGSCCFETDPEVPEAMMQAFGTAAEEWIRNQGDKYYVNLKEINALALRRAGVTHIEVSTACTMCEHERYWSHRYTKGLRGSQGAIIVCKEG